MVYNNRQVNSEIYDYMILEMETNAENLSWKKLSAYKISTFEW